MEKIELVATMRESKKVIDFLQRKGMVELTSHELPDGMLNPDTDYNISQLERFTQTAKKAKETLSQYVPEKKSLVDSFKLPREMEMSKFLDMSESADKTMNMCYDILGAQKSIDNAHAQQIRLKTSNEALEVWKELDIPTKFKSTRYVTVLIGTFPDSQTDASIKEALAERIPEIEAIETEVVYTSEMQSCAVVMCLKKDANTVTEALRSMGFVRPTEISDKTPKEMLKENRITINELDKQILEAQSEIAAMASAHEDIDFLIDYFTMRADKYEQFKKVSLSDNVLYLSGYIPVKYAEKTVEQLENKFTVAITLSEPEEDEEVPVLLENNAFAAGVEGITEMYSLPGKNDIDPNAIMSFFYYLFFGMMFSDAGYGLIMILATTFALKKLRPSPSMKQSMRLFRYCGISTFLWGLVYGSFFGDSIAVISESFFGHKVALPALIDPMNGDAVTMLILSLALGLIEIIVGLCAKFATCMKNGDKAGAFFDAGLWITELLGLTVMAAGFVVLPSLKTVGIVLAIGSAIGLILTQGRDKKNPVARIFSGITSLYDITSYVSDLLSFSRLMALGLTTSAMSAVFNMLAGMGGRTVGGFLMLIIIFPLGHAINFGLNILGAYVHTLRLQYVELFSKFYEGGGKEFKAFSTNTKYTQLDLNSKEEN